MESIDVIENALITTLWGATVVYHLDTRYDKREKDIVFAFTSLYSIFSLSTRLMKLYNKIKKLI